MPVGCHPPGETGDQAGRDRGRGPVSKMIGIVELAPFAASAGRSSRGGRYHVNLAADKIGGQCRQPFISGDVRFRLGRRGFILSTGIVVARFFVPALKHRSGDRWWSISPHQLGADFRERLPADWFYIEGETKNMVIEYRYAHEDATPAAGTVDDTDKGRE